MQTKGDKRYEFENPLDRNARDARILREVLIGGGLRNTPVETVLVCTAARPGAGPAPQHPVLYPQDPGPVPEHQPF